ncbi:MAG: hypothetical protein IJ463_06680 [Bacilli bacterium]|nr:hypothetical protein [Bacilli bacterium]
MEDKFKIYNETEKENEEVVETKEDETVEEEKEVSTEEVETTVVEETENEEKVEEAVVEPPKKEEPTGNDNSKLIIIILAIVVLIAAIVAVIVPSMVKEEEKTIVTDKQEVKSEYRLEGNHLQDFDISFLKLENGEKNIIYSPLSIKYALQMLAEGTAGESKEQLDAILGEYQPKKYANNANMSFANAMYINQLYKTQVKDEYTKTLVDKYYAEVIYDSFEKADNMNKWISDKTFGLIDNLVSDDQVNGKAFFLINALAIDMEWNKKIQADNLDENVYGVSYEHEKYGHYISPVQTYNQPEVEFNNGKMKAKALEIGASINKYDIVEELGEETIRNTITKEYNEFVTRKTCGDGPYEETETFVTKYIKELDSNYGKLDTSTDFEFYVDEEVKVFAKDLKTYEGTTLQYVGIMPIKETVTDFVNNTSASEYNELIKSLKTVESDNFKEGVVTKITGFIPTFSFDYQLDLEEDLKKLKVTDIFDVDKADLTGILPEKGNYISDTLHKATIEFSNDGIKAAAVTTLGGMGAAGCGYEHLYEIPVEVIDLTFDKPYVFFIRDKKTNEIWFTGTVYEPNKSEGKTSMN